MHIMHTYFDPLSILITTLGLLVSELSREPWKGKVITFSERPQLHTIQGNCLRSKTEFIRSMEWGMNTNFQRVFDRILEVATEGKLSAAEMVRKVFVFSDMEFDEASSNPNPWEPYYGASTNPNQWKPYYGVSTNPNQFEPYYYGASSNPNQWKPYYAASSNSNQWEPYYEASSWETDYEAIKRKFRESGYGAAVPQIVFWNLRDSSSTPVAAKQAGVALVSGFSKNLMKVFLDDEGDISPEAVMEAAISGEEYRDLFVVD